MENHLPVKLIIYSQAPEVQESLLSSSPENTAREVSEFYVSTSLLRNASPVFASMLDGPWKESGEGAIPIHSFEPDAFRVFLDCLQHLSNATARSGDALIFTPSVIRKVLPIAHFFQVDVMKQQIISTVMEIMKQCQDSKVTEPRFIKAADLMFAVEANISETEIPDWPERTLEQAARLMFDCSAEDDGGGFKLSLGKRRPIVSGLVVKANVDYNSDIDIDDLSKKTLKKCIQSLSLQIKWKISGDRLNANKSQKLEDVSWPQVSYEIL
jgi:hypothetical protein